MIERFHVGLSKLESDRRYQYLLLGAITLLAAALRFYKLGEWSFWIDELSSTNRALAHYNNLEAIIRNLPTTFWLPLSLISMGGVFKVLGTSEWSARLVPAIIGIISIPILYFPIKRLFGTSIGLLAMLLLAVSPWHLYWSQNARFYTSLLLLYSLALFAFFYAIEQDRPGYILFFILLLYLAMSERLIALFLVPVVVCYLLFLKIMPLEKPPGLRARNLLLVLLTGIGIGIIEIYWYLSTGLSPLLDAYYTFAGKQINDPFRLLISAVFNIGVPLVILAVFGGIYLLLQKSRLGLLIFIGALVPLILLVVANPFVFTVDRYVFMTLPFWAILGAIAVKEIITQTENYGKVLAIGVLIVLLADAASSNLLYYQINNGNRRDWRGAFAFVQERKQEGDIVVSTRPQLGEYYLEEQVISAWDIDPDIIVRSGERAWFVFDSTMIWTAPIMKSWFEANGNLMDVQYLRVPEDISLSISLFDLGHVETLE